MHATRVDTQRNIQKGKLDKQPESKSMVVGGGSFLSALPPDVPHEGGCQGARLLVGRRDDDRNIVDARELGVGLQDHQPEDAGDEHDDHEGTDGEAHQH